MTNKVKPIPEGYHTITPYLFVKNAAEAMKFYQKAFGAKEVLRMPFPDGRLGHAEMIIGSSRIMLADEFPEMDALSPLTVGGVPVMMHLYVENVDEAFDRAVKAGAKVITPVEDQCYGDRSGSVVDPFGHRWYISTRKENLTVEEIKERFEKMEMVK